MPGFNYDSFVDLTQRFNIKKEDGKAALAWRLRAQPKFRPVRLIDAKKIMVKTATSRFADFKTLRIVMTPRFELAARAPIKPKRTLSLKLAAATVPMANLNPAPTPTLAPSVAPVAAEVQPTPAKATSGGTLKLKTKVDLPPPVMISKRSTTNDLAAAFKTEMRVLTEKKAPEETSAQPLAPPVPEKRRNGGSSLQKGWAQLIAEAEAPPPKVKDFDLRSAFKTEMKALLARQELDMNDNTPAPAPTPALGSVVPFPAKYDKFSLATKRRILGHGNR